MVGKMKTVKGNMGAINIYQIDKDKKISLDNINKPIYFFLKKGLKMFALDIYDNAIINIIFEEKDYQDKLEITINIKKKNKLIINNYVLTKKLELKETVNLDLEGSVVEQKTLVYSKDKAKHNIDFNFNNNKSNTKSIQNVLVIGANNSNTVINSNGKIQASSSNSVTHETLNGINKRNSKISLNPILLIENNNVIASHSATCGFLDEMELYYLMTRGIRKKDAENILTNALIEPFIKDLDEPIKKKIDEYLGI